MSSQDFAKMLDQADLLRLFTNKLGEIAAKDDDFKGLYNACKNVLKEEE
jgi:hypothetical protein